MKQHQTTAGATDDWITPLWILEALGTFELDPCACDPQPWPTANKMLNKTLDGLAWEWDPPDRIWMNPPFNRAQRPIWMQRMAEHGNGVMLIPAATETDAFAKHVWGRASGILFLDRRPNFCRPDGSEAAANSGCSICLVAYGAENLAALIASGLGPVVTQLRTEAA